MRNINTELVIYSYIFLLPLCVCVHHISNKNIREAPASKVPLVALQTVTRKASHANELFQKKTHMVVSFDDESFFVTTRNQYRQQKNLRDF